MIKSKSKLGKFVYNHSPEVFKEIWIDESDDLFGGIVLTSVPRSCEIVQPAVNETIVTCRIASEGFSSHRGHHVVFP